ncbi:unnamed protein product [Euphydryas editha]|uniref:Isochorismatase domain-containing protein 1 n=1 Tax=Euphydryas editha TaxID=104508 RepID=A0AAU9TF54_EUPED|nr:unnamed protein product [Euphydryas editha]
MAVARKLFKLGALEAKKTAFLVSDLQEKFRPNIKHFEEVVRTANKMIEGAKCFKIPVYVSELEPKTYGPTVFDIDTSKVALVYDKEEFSMYNEKLKRILKKDVPELQSVVIFGVAAHVCVEITAMDFLSEDINVHVLADGVSSRSTLDRSLALQRLQSIGCIVGTSENVLLKLLRDQNHPAYEQVSKLINNKTISDCK